MYRGRDFDFVSVSANTPDEQKGMLAFLQKQHASNGNLLFASDDTPAMQKAFDPKWESGVPYTVLIAPGGKILATYQGDLNILDYGARSWHTSHPTMQGSIVIGLNCQKATSHNQRTVPLATNGHDRNVLFDPNISGIRLSRWLLSKRMLNKAATGHRALAGNPRTLWFRLRQVRERRWSVGLLPSERQLTFARR